MKITRRQQRAERATDTKADFHPAESDCEHASSSVGQPVNTLSSLAMAGIGLAIERRASKADHPRSARWIGSALAAAGLGSVAYHGPGGGGHWVHDVTLLLPATALAVASETDLRGSTDRDRRMLMLGTAGVLAAGRTRGAHRQDLLSAIVAAGLGVAIVRRVKSEADHHGRWLAAGGAMAGTGVIAFGLSRTGGPLCDPHSRLQGHGIWHICAAIAAVATAQGLDQLHRHGAVEPTQIRSEM